MARKKIYKTKRQQTKAQTRWTSEWGKEHSKIINVRFNAETDKDILDKLDAVGNKTDYIRQLIREDIKKG